MLIEEIFRAYDIRGIYPTEINEEAAYRIAGAYAAYLQLSGKTVAVGRDVRLSSPSLQQAVMKGLTEAGVNVVDIGLGPTELMYYAVGSLYLDGGLQVSASHNPGEYNGIKMVKGGNGVNAISMDTGIAEIRDLALSSQDFRSDAVGTVKSKDLTDAYVNFVSNFFDVSGLPKLKIVANNNFGASGPLAKQIFHSLNLPIELVELNFTPDGSFPKGPPNPLLAENRAETSQAVKDENADLGISWDCDGDRCFFTDEHGQYIEGSYVTALFAQFLLRQHPGAKIVCDVRNLWTTQAAIEQAGGVPILAKVGHSFIKDKMKAERALYAGELSGHHYFQDFYFADNGLISMMLFLSVIKTNPKPVSALVAEFREKFPVSGEINFRVKDVAETIADLKSRFPTAETDTFDGLSLTSENWRASIRSSSNEPVLRLNVESRDEDTLMIATNRLTEIIHYHTETH